MEILQVHERKRLLQSIARAKGMEIPIECMNYMAHHLNTDTRGLEEALVRVVAYSSVMNREMDEKTVAEALQGLVPFKRSSTHHRGRNYPSILFSRKAALAVLSSILLIGGCSATESKQVISQAVETTAEQPVVVAPEETKVAAAQEITLKGRTEAFQEMFVSPSVPSNVKEIYAELGVYVKKGDKLALMFEGDLAHQLRQAEARVKSIEVNTQIQKIEQQIALNQMKVEIAAGSADGIEDAELAVLQAEAALTEAQKNYENEQLLFQQGGIPRQQVDQAQKAISQAEQQLNKAKQFIELRKKRASEQKVTEQVISQLQKESTAAAAQLTKMGIEQAKVELELVQYQVNNLTVEAPINGYITKSNAIVGSAVTQGPMFVITNLDRVFIHFHVPEALINQIKPEQVAALTIPTLGKTFEGKVTYVSQVADGNGFPAKVLVDNPNHEIKGGMQAQVSIKSTLEASK